MTRILLLLAALGALALMRPIPGPAGQLLHLPGLDGTHGT